MKKLMIEVTMDESLSHQPLAIRQLKEGPWNNVEIIGIMDILRQRAYANLDGGKKFEGKFSKNKNGKKEKQ